MRFNRSNLKNFFDTEKALGCEVVEDFYLTYFIRLDHDFSFELFLVSYEDKAIITVKNKLDTIADIDLKMVGSVLNDDHFLYFYAETYSDTEQETDNPFFVVRVKPFFSCSFTVMDGEIGPTLKDVLGNIK